MDGEGGRYQWMNLEGGDKWIDGRDGYIDRYLMDVAKEFFDCSGVTLALIANTNPGHIYFTCVRMTR